MADQPSPSRRRRPVDALFGDEDAPQLPSYVVDPPQPPATVAPPPPAPAPTETAVPPPPADNAPATLVVESTAAPAAAAMMEPNASPIREPTLVEPPRAAPVVEEQRPHLATAPTTPITRTEPAVFSAEPMPVMEPPESSRVAAPSTPPYDERQVYFTYLPETIRELYDEVSTQLSDSPAVADYCMRVLLLARQSLLDADYAAAEFYVQQVDAKLKRNQRSMQAAHSGTMRFLAAWEFFMLVVCGALVVITFIPALTLFGLPIASELIVLIRAAAWGGIGGVIGAFYNMPWFVQHREYDPAYNLGYFGRPVQGMLLGAILFLISQAGILAGNVVIPALPGSTATEGIALGPIFLYVFAVLAGFKQEYVYEFFDNILRAVFRMPRIPDELQIPEPPVKRR